MFYVLCWLLPWCLFRWRVALLFAPLWTYSLSLFFFIFFFFQKPSGSMFYELVFTLCKYRQIERDCMSLCCCSIPPPSSSNLLFPLLVFWLGLTALLELGHQLNNRQLSKIKPIGIRKTNNKKKRTQSKQVRQMRKKRITDCAPNAFISFGSPPERISDALAMKAQHENQKTVQPLPPPLLGTGVAQ